MEVRWFPTAQYLLPRNKLLSATKFLENCLKHVCDPRTTPLGMKRNLLNQPILPLHQIFRRLSRIRQQNMYRSQENSPQGQLLAALRIQIEEMQVETAEEASQPRRSTRHRRRPTNLVPRVLRLLGQRFGRQERLWGNGIFSIFLIGYSGNNEIGEAEVGSM